MFVNPAMKQMLSILTFLLLSNEDAVAENTGKLTGDLRVVGGTDASELPTLAFNTGTPECAATLIHAEYVIDCI